MKHILCFGDSNTFGHDPTRPGRHPDDVRWTGVLQTLLGSEMRVIEEGMGGRTTTPEDPAEPLRRGLPGLRMALYTHSPIDLVVIMLGTNDLKTRFAMTETDMRHAVEALLQEVRQHPYAGFCPGQKILVVSPVRIRPGVSAHFASFDEEAPARSALLATAQRAAAEAYGAAFFDAATVAEASDEDRLHLNAENHRRLGEALVPVVRALLLNA